MPSDECKRGCVEDGDSPMHRRFVLSLMVLVLVLPSLQAWTQDRPTSPGGQKIGLVLEGGGALGMAHIGVLQWMEEHHVPVRYVSGTSMGGLVGGLYAIG